MNKRKAQTKHARRRARERYGIDLDDHARQTIIGRIRRGESTLVRRQSNRVSVHRVRFAGVVMRVVYDRNRRNIVTVM